jgi:hypothetical protein
MSLVAFSQKVKVCSLSKTREEGDVLKRSPMENKKNMPSVGREISK